MPLKNNRLHANANHNAGSPQRYCIGTRAGLECDVMIILIPTFNEEACIETVLADTAAISKANGYRILVVDDGSTDGTIFCVRSHPDHPDTIAILPLTHGGKDAALWAGIEEADDAWIGMMDADGQYDPADFSGSRRRPTPMAPMRCGVFVTNVTIHAGGC